MQTYILQIALIVASIDQFSVAQSDAVPACAEVCLENLYANSPGDGCNTTDGTCTCSNQQFISTYACCLKEEPCDIVDQQAAINFYAGLCASGGIPVDSIKFICDQPSFATTFTVSSTSTTSTSAQSLLSSETSSSVSSFSTSTLIGLDTSGSSLKGSSSTASILSTPPSSIVPLTALPSKDNSAIPGNSGLSTGKLVGLGFGIACAIVLILAVYAIVILRRRNSGRGLYFWRRTRPISGLPDGNSELPADAKSTIPEMETKANTHEISSKAKTRTTVQMSPVELSSNSYLRKNPDVGNEPRMAAEVAQAQEHFDAFIQYSSEANSSALQKADLPQTSELENSSHADDNYGIQPSQTHSTVPLELEVQSSSPAMTRETPQSQPSTQSESQSQSLNPSGAIPRKSLPSSKPFLSEVTVEPETAVTATSPGLVHPLAASAATAQVEGSGSSEFSRLSILQAQIDKVREEKGRLARLQELNYLEAELQREIMEEQKREYKTSENLG